jgi:hypothetical protein
VSTIETRAIAKKRFTKALEDFVADLGSYVCTENGQWAVKGFIDIYRNVYSISNDTKITSKILEIHIFPQLLAFAERERYELVLTEHQNHYPDMSFVSKVDQSIKFALDLKTTYRKPDKPYLCNGFTLGSFGEYFRNRDSLKNIRFPYGSYSGHFCLGVIYDRAHGATIDETVVVALNDLEAIASVMSNMQFFVTEKWKIASDRKGSGNTANIGSIELIEDILLGQGMFANLGEEWFDEYWMNYGQIMVMDGMGGAKAITNLLGFVNYKQGDPTQIVLRRTKV